jgi:AraC family transcriptional regulator of adaptative response / DNA-3-methyladenine glycosylase II
MTSPRESALVYDEPMDRVVAIATTGIYCRPGCSAQPQPQNRRWYLLAAAAEADGYRACLRCRPYRYPLRVPATAPDLVCRAVSLILDGAFEDERTERHLADRLGVSARHLRRLFDSHLGVTPSALARSARAHFARRLLDDTDFTITEVAFVTGFGSVRAFNRALRQTFRATPRELRAKRRKADRLVADGGLVLRLPYHGQLDWAGMARFFAGRAIPGVEAVAGDVYRRTIAVGGDPGVLELSAGGEGYLLLRAHLPHWEELTHIVSRARRTASLDLNLDSAMDRLASDSLLGPMVRSRPGLRPPGAWDPFEVGIRAIIGQQVSLQAANHTIGRLVEQHGVPVPGLRPMGLTHTFPAPATLASARLSGMGLTASKREAVRAFSRAVVDSRLPLDGSVSLDRLLRCLLRMPGIGPWTASYLALRLGELDAWPANDLGLRRALDRVPLTGSPEPADPARWRPWRAVAATYLWMADSDPEQASQPGAA